MKNITKILLFIYFLNLFLFSLFSLMSIQEMTDVFWFIRIPILLILYLVTSVKRDPLYIIGLALYQSASVFFYFDTPQAFIYATFSSMLFKLCMVLLVLVLVTRENYKAVGIAFIPFFVIYLYIIEIVVSYLGETYYIWILNAFLTSFIGGVAIINYVNNDGQKNFWLLVSSILFIIQIAAFFINKFYIKSEGIYQMVILSYGISHYTFYRFIVMQEEEKLLSR